MNAVLRELLETKTSPVPGGDPVPLHSAISGEEAALLAEAVSELGPTTSLEVGLAFGVSALAICDALPGNPGTRHIVIDPHQHHPEMWRGAGLHNLERAGFGDLIEFHEGPAHRVLPRLEEQGVEVDFAFIDGFHTFDYVMTDLFHVDKMLRVGGAVAFDDAEWPSIRRVVRYAASNLPYSVWKVLPGARKARTLRRKAYDAALAAAGLPLRALCLVPGLRRPVAQAFGAELMGADRRLGLVGNLVVLRKEGEDQRRYFHHVEF
jgi:predicted O-methyltransferase YrrM